VGYGNGIKSGPVVVMDAKTIKIPAFSYDGKGEEVYFFAGEGPQPSSKVPVLRIRIRDLKAGTFLTPGSGMSKKNQDPDPESESLETIFSVKNT
jgi:hypothetical protein